HIRAAAGWPAGASIELLDPHSGYAPASNPPLIDRIPGGRERGLRSGLAVVIGGSSKPYGVLGAHSLKVRKFTQDDAAFMQAIANIIAQAVERLAGEQVLRRNEAYFRTLIQASSDVILVLKPDGTIAF